MNENSNNSYPKITVVTPSYNQGQFIEETILSVIGQNYPNLEYIIIDGGSTDSTVEVIRRYEKYLTYWVSEKDEGQAAAINKGFSTATGDILCWLNSDDMFMPGALKFMADTANFTDEVIYFGNCIHFKETKNGVETFGSNVQSAYKDIPLSLCDIIIQPSSFWNRKTWLKIGNLNESYHFGFDWVWFLSAQSLNIKFSPVSKVLSIYRIHDSHKSGSGGNLRQNELQNIYDKHAPKYGILYSHLRKEKFINTSYIRIQKILFKVLRLNYSDIDLLKLNSPNKYKDYTNKEITVCKSML